MEFNDVVVTVLVTVLTAVISYCGNVLVKNNRALTIVRALEPLAKDAVIAAQKLGVTEYLSGVAKKIMPLKMSHRRFLTLGSLLKMNKLFLMRLKKHLRNSAIY